MYQIIKNRAELERWLKIDDGSVEIINQWHNVKEYLTQSVDILDKYYGAERDIEKDLGGYTVVFYGERWKEDFQKLLDRYRLREEEYELYDIYRMPERHIEVAFRLYICSSDYSLEVVTIEGGIGNNNSE